MPRTTKKEAALIQRVKNRHVTEEVRNVCATLETIYDGKALELLFTHGIFAIDHSDAPLDQVISELVDDEAISDKLVDLGNAITSATTASEARRKAFLELEDLEIERLTTRTQAAYLLGIAVGRRLNSLPLAGGVR